MQMSGTVSKVDLNVGKEMELIFLLCRKLLYPHALILKGFKVYRKR